MSVMLLSKPHSAKQETSMINGTRNFLGTTGGVRFGVSTVAQFCPATAENAK